ncbi:hypothetical protein [Paludisphaera rhizosphaerae]|uniref:hypothetical protein n=1 Tax=Paludisphaera rhizosphaerae TaxID=2711216 RepID=UPI0013EB3840|nr:hypothetical protein [Paludisphaera rhizosphaerae]
MTAETIRSALKMDPFRPFAINTMDGRSTRVDRPEMLTCPGVDVVRVDLGDGHTQTIALDSIVSLSFRAPRR